ncbi:hypothetical protein [Streptacidiphilus jiangxiensis]|uniref:Uncharacterized protein n=1 Tax=Streptacidiphilus jiangxiensis TaxID=235985 RepID=A0A1H7UBA0_STRJI|nr:hypothetical protein [Streptacidiphilus jiangxiensis]SEL94024.1 hypothetical protein SAMN05414137_115177 [Streptacidiphilus jiangxiensis]
MAQLLIEENFQHLDGEDVESLIEAFGALGLSAEPTQPRTDAETRRGWVLVLHWLRDDTTALDPVLRDGSIAAAVRGALQHQHPIGPDGTEVRERTLPRRVEIRDRDSRVLAEVEVAG